MKRAINIVRHMLCIALLQSCASPSPPPLTKEEIACRDEAPLGRYPVYRVSVPNGWVRHDSPVGESIADTTKSLCSFTLTEGDQTLRVTIHNFPSNRIEERIAPGAQIMRWKRQFAHLDSDKVIPQAFGGFSGLCMEAVGPLQEGGEEMMVLAWSMQLGHEHYTQLCVEGAEEERHRCKQMRADYTIKAVGPAALMQRHRKTIVSFARSFELIEEIPSRL